MWSSRGGICREIYDALKIVSDDTSAAGVQIDVIAEVEQHLGENRVRAVAMKPTDGMQRGMRVVDLGEPISVPVGPKTLGRVLNVLGEPVDFPDRPVEAEERWPIHRPAPKLEEQSTELQIFETGIKVIDLLETVLAGRQDRLVRWARGGEDRDHHGAHPQHRAEARRRVGLRRRGRADA